MNKLAIVLAAAAVLFVAAAPSADAANKKLWEGFMEDVKTLQGQIAGKMGKK
jgi:type IV secretory pathway VirB2 component (pilin)